MDFTLLNPVRLGGSRPPLLYPGFLFHPSISSIYLIFLKVVIYSTYCFYFAVDSYCTVAIGISLL